MSGLPADLREPVLRLSGSAEFAAAVCEAAAGGAMSHDASVDAICSAAGLPLARRYDVTHVLDIGVACGVFVRSGPVSWRAVASVELLNRLALTLNAVAIFFRDVHRDRNEVEVVLTRPPHPSELEQQLAATGYGTVGLENTEEQFTAMAARAQQTLLVMTPFLDAHGARRLLMLFSRAAPSVRKTLVLRFKSTTEVPSGYLATADELRKLDVEVFDYFIPRDAGAGYESFHAKSLLIDRRECYLGSANITEASLGYSMELGFVVRGTAAERVALVLDAILAISRRRL